jgi:hypothetical protein
MNRQRTVKITPRNMGRIIKGCLAEDAPVEIVDSWSASLASEIEGAWAEGLEAFATESGLLFAKPGAMEECDLASA